jgi:hypothetical protein
MESIKAKLNNHLWVRNDVLGTHNYQGDLPTVALHVDTKGLHPQEKTEALQNTRHGNLQV